MSSDGVQILEPADGAVLPFAVVPLKYQVRDLDGVAHALILVDGLVYANDSMSLAPYLFSDHPIRIISCTDGRTIHWPGPHTIQIQSTDGIGNVTTAEVRIQLK